ncbi:gliding motility protein GldL [Olivibacter sitiensis]|uniref:type IX secretion system motor protein PorL/GldL n=1 Tax=Olivibacter sitiensis TaxID=376470 RepID=UPI0003FD22B1|nr:gliding motility protein GldL [Olivibacter sitiensis]
MAKAKGKNPGWLHVAISWGASIVIIGAMFKINHWGGSLGTYLIGAGLTIEAILFFLTGLYPPAEDPHWEKVYPELADDYSGPLPVRQNVAAAPSSTAALDKMLNDANLSPKSFEQLGAGLKVFSEKIGAINQIADASLDTREFSEKLRTASSKFDSLSIAFEKATSNLSSIGETKTDTEAYQTQVTKLATNLGALNSIYESELKESSSNLQKINSYYTNLAETLQNFADSSENTAKFKEEANKLAKNVATLNSIYGNMLSALNQPRV